VYDALLMYVSHRAAQLRYPEAHGFFCEGLPRDVEPQIAAIHQIDHYVSALVSTVPVPASCDTAYKYSMSWKL
jgi:hypothetical protein